MLTHQIFYYFSQMNPNQGGNLTLEDTIRADINAIHNTTGEEKEEIQKRLYQNFKKYIKQNEKYESIKDIILNLIEEKCPDIVHILVHLIIEIFFSKGKSRWIATAIGSLITSLPSFVITEVETRDITQSFINSVPWLINAWIRSAIGHGFNYGIDKYNKECVKNVFKICHGLIIAISPSFTNFSISLIYKYLIKH